MSFSVAACDDEPRFADLMADHLLFLNRMQALNLSVLRFTDPQKMLAAHRDTPFDAIFLDIDMPALSGFDVAAEIRNCSPRTRIIFVTAKHDLVYESFEYTPFYFICKVSDDKLKQDLSHVLRKLLINNRQNIQLTIYDSSYGKQILPVSDILYIISEKHYRLYHTLHNTIPFKERGTLTEKEIELFAYHFIKPHRRYLVNAAHIQRFDSFDQKILLDNGEWIPVSKNMKEEAFRMYMEHKRN